MDRSFDVERYGSRALLTCLREGRNYGRGVDPGDEPPDRGEVMAAQSDRVALVTGGSGALGGAVAARLEADGWCVARVIRRGEPKLLKRSATLVADLAEAVGAEAAVRQTVEHFGRLDALVAAAGAWQGGAPVHAADPETLPAMWRANGATAYWAARAASSAMLSNADGGWIVLVGAASAEAGAPGQAAYNMTKAAVTALAKTLARELLPHRVSVNAILPSILDTAKNRADMPHARHEDWVQLSHVASLVAFLLSADGKDVTGAAIPVTGHSA